MDNGQNCALLRRHAFISYKVDCRSTVCDTALLWEVVFRYIVYVHSNCMSFFQRSYGQVYFTTFVVFYKISQIVLKRTSIVVSTRITHAGKFIYPYICLLSHISSSHKSQTINWLPFNKICKPNGGRRVMLVALTFSKLPK